MHHMVNPKHIDAYMPVWQVLKLASSTKFYSLYKLWELNSQCSRFQTMYYEFGKDPNARLLELREVLMLAIKHIDKQLEGNTDEG